MLKIVLCDDNREAVKQYAELISKCAEKHNVEIELSCFYSGETLLFHFCDAPNQVDIIYLDIIMDKTDGMETAKKLRKYGCHAQIVFLTSCDDYVYDAFDVNAVQYLLKDEITKEKFEEIFLRTVKLASQKEEELFICEFDGIKKAIPVSSISYFEIWKRVVTVHFNGNETAKFYSSMEDIEKQFADKAFARVHRSYVVHLPYIAQIQRKNLILKTGEIIPVGVTYVQPLKNIFSEYIFRSHVYEHGFDKYYGGKL